MRNKQRPTKSIRHKSVTSMICPEISFKREERHGVMRLAFLENNDITPETDKDFDYNTLSTLILNRNIRQDLQEPHHPPTTASSSSASNTNTSSNSTSASLITNRNRNRNRIHNNYNNEINNTNDNNNHNSINNNHNNHNSITITVDTGRKYDATPDTRRVKPPVVALEQANIERLSRKKPRAPRAAALAAAANIPQQQQQASVSPEPKTTSMNSSGQFLCDEPDCGKTFPSLRKLRHHKVVHSDEFPFVCQFQGCGKRFKRKFGIDLHSTTHFDLDPEMYHKTNNNSVYTFFGRRFAYSSCKLCKQKFKTVHEFQDHMQGHGVEPFYCYVEGCGQTFSIWKSFQKHRASHYFNYFCRMDKDCNHSTSNLQLLKLHIYCCHFRRTLPANATMSRPRVHENSHEETDDQQVDDQQVEDPEMLDEDEGNEPIKDEAVVHEEETKEAPHDGEAIDPLSMSQESDVSTPRRDPRLRRNPPRSSTFGQQDYASINNGSSYAKLTSSPQPVRRARPSASGSQPNTADKKNNGRSPAKVLPKRACASITSGGSQHSTPEKRAKLPLKVLPKRSAQRLPMSMIAADDGSTEDDDRSDVSSSRNERRSAEPGQARFQCHLCDYQFSVRFQLTKHLSTHLELSPSMYKATSDARVIQLTERRRREFYCENCSLKFEKGAELDAHMRKHGARPYVCPFCVYSTFKYAKQYLSHLYEHRFNYRCTVEPNCEFSINRKDALKLHIFRVHLDQKLPAYIENFATMRGCDQWTEQ